MADEKSGCLALPGNLIVPAPRVKGPDAGRVGAPLAFTCKSGFKPLAKQYKHAWDFGDGTATEPEKGHLDASHAYARPGTYAVRVREDCPWGFHSKWSAGKAVVVS